MRFIFMADTGTDTGYKGTNVLDMLCGQMDDGMELHCGRWDTCTGYTGT